MDRKTYYIFVGGIVCAALILSYIYFPSREDLAWMFFYDRRYDRSAEQFHEFFSREDRSRKAVLSRVLLQVQLADIGEAIAALEGYVEENPTDLEARFYLSDLYEQAGRPRAYLRNLEVIYKLAPNIEVLGELKRSYEELNIPENLLKATQELVDFKAAQVEDYRVLAELYASRGDTDIALATLDLMLERFTIEELDEQTVMFAVRFFLDQGENAKALLLASRYGTTRVADVGVLVTLSYLMLEAGEYEEAQFLTDLIPESKKGEPNVLQLRIWILLAKDDEEGVYRALRREFEKGELPSVHYTRLTLLALTFEDDELAGQMVRELDYTEASESDLVALVATLIARRNVDLAKKLQQNLGEDYLAEHPVIEVGLLIAEKGSLDDEEIADFEQKYPPGERIGLALFLYSSGQSEIAVRLARSVRSLDEIDVNVLDTVAMLYINLNLLDQIGRMVDEYEVEPGLPRYAYDRARLFVLAAEGDIEELGNEFAQMRTVSSQLLQELFQIAEKMKQKQATLWLAEVILGTYPVPYNETFLARALALNRRPQEALNIIRRLEREGLDVRESYFYVLVLAAAQDAVYKRDLEDFISSVVDDEKVRGETKRTWGYTLIDYEMGGKAAPLFKFLAEGQHFLSGDMQTLLFLWGEDLSRNQVGWIMEQAKGSEGEELAGWVAHLVWNKYPGQGADLAEREGWKHPKVAEIYIEALRAAKRRLQLEEVLALQVQRDDNVERLKKMGKLAYDLGIYHTAEKAYLKTLIIDPELSEPLKYLGMIDFSMGNYHRSKWYLQSYLQTDDPDYQGYYYYGQIYWIYKYWKCARKYFCTALRLLIKDENRDIYSELVEAQLYYRMGCFAKALCLYEDLIDRAPKKAFFRIDYANVLILLEKYCRAKYLLETIKPETDEDLDHVQLKNARISRDIATISLYRNLNRLKTAWRIASKLLRQYPDEPRIMVVKAELELLLGRWQRSVEWLEAAIQRQPRNEGWKRIQREIFCERTRNFFMQREYKLTGTNQSEIIDELLVYHRIDRNNIFKFRAGSDQLSLSEAFDVITDTAEPFRGTRYRGEIALEREFDNGLVVELRGFLAREGLGAGLESLKKDFYGESRLQLWYHRQTWEFTQSIIDFGLEDRVEFYRFQNMGPRTSWFGQGGYRWYHLAKFGLAAESYVFTTGINYRLHKLNVLTRKLGDDSSVFFNFFIDAQYPTFEKRVFSPVVDEEVAPLSIQKRENWVWQMSFNKTFNPSFRMEGFAGATWDRANQGPVGPIGGLVAYIGRECGPQLRFHYLHTFSSQFETETTDRLIADFKIPY
jgi:hypothetical protein